jgi:hypothetical protein
MQEPVANVVGSVATTSSFFILSLISLHSQRALIYRTRITLLIAPSPNFEQTLASIHNNLRDFQRPPTKLIKPTKQIKLWLTLQYRCTFEFAGIQEYTLYIEIWTQPVRFSWQSWATSRISKDRFNLSGVATSALLHLGILSNGGHLCAAFNSRCKPVPTLSD